MRIAAYVATIAGLALAAADLPATFTIIWKTAGAAHTANGTIHPPHYRAPSYTDTKSELAVLVQSKGR